MKISICDDDNLFTAEFCNKINQLKPYDGNYEIDVYNNSKDMLINLNKHYHIFFMDINLQEDIEGIEIAKQIRTCNSRALIVFLTGISTPTTDIFKVLPFRYLVKPIDSDMEIELWEIFEEALKNIEYLVLKCSGAICKVRIESIIYITIVHRNINIITDEGTYVTSDKIDTMYEKLAPSGFAFTHKSYLVNLNRIYKLESNSVKLDNGTIIPISQPKSSRFKREFTQYAVQKGWNG